MIQDAQEMGGSIKGSIVDSPGIIALWGIFYFILMIIFELTNVIKPVGPKKNYPPTADELLAEINKNRGKIRGRLP
jgi:hypothetical protein